VSVTSEKLKTINWLQYYGITRMLGSTPGQSVLISNMPVEQSVLAFESIVAASRQRAQANEAPSEYLGATIGNLAGAIPVIGGLMSIVIRGAGWVARLAIRSQQWGCSKSCKRYDARNLINLCPPPLTQYQKGMDHIVRALNDGLVVDGLGTPNSPDDLGRSVGVVGYREPNCDAGARQKATTINEEYRKASNPAWTSAYRFAPTIAKGDRAVPYRSQGNNWYWRAYCVGQLERWLERKMPCNILMCVGDTMRNLYEGTRSGIDSALNPPSPVRREAWDFGRRVGSRWYASIYYMHKDIWDFSQQLPVDEVVRLATENGCLDFARFYRARVSAVWTQEQLAKEPFPGFSATSTLSWGGAQKMIPALCGAIQAGRTPTVSLAPGAAWLRANAGKLTPYQAPAAQGSQQTTSEGLVVPLLIGAGVLGAVLLLGRK